MKVSLNWLRELVELPPTVDELVSLLTMAGVEVEGIETTGCAIPNVVVAEIKESVQHPQADRLSVCQVDDGSGTARQIVCGAKNYQVGDKVPLALPGAKLPGDFVIKTGKLRGVESQGMMCSADELGLGKDSEGLLILPRGTPVGTPIGELFKGDTVLDLEITPNRPDLLSYVGMAREVATLTGKVPVALPGHANPPTEWQTENGVQIEDEALCPLYSARRIRGLKVGPSPDWLRGKLEAVGLRSINNVVDVTNYVMLEAGQPLHAFDAAKLRGDLQVRSAREGEAFAALDGKTYTLQPQHLVIADGERAVALAGVMGGAETGVTETTTEIVLESAYFQPQSIRRTSRQLGLASDSSYRFERGVDSEGVVPASTLAVDLILKLAGGAASPELLLPRGANAYSHIRAHAANGSPALQGSGTAAASAEDVDVDIPSALIPRDETPMPEDVTLIPLRLDRVKRLLGVEVSEERAEEILTGFGLRKRAGGWVAPSFRRDLTREVDLIEEIARVIGMEIIPAREQARFAPASATDRAYDRAMALRRALVAQGMHEARSVTLVPAEPRGLAFTQVDTANLVRVKNPMIDDQVVLRPNLLHGLLTAVTTNIRAGAESVRLFEIGRVFSTRRPEEFSHAAVVLSGAISERTWRGAAGRAADLYDLKALLAAALGSSVAFKADKNPALALSLVIENNGKPIGFAGQLWPADARALDAKEAVVFAEVDLTALEKSSTAADQARKYREIPRFPAVTRDIAMLAPLSLPHAEIASALTSAKEPLLAGVELFDVFTDATGAKIPADKKSLAYSLTYRSAERTLTAEEVNAAHAKLKEKVKPLGVTLRE